MLNTEAPVIKKFIADAHECLERRYRKLSEEIDYDREVRENRLLKLMCDDWTREPRRYAEDLNLTYGYNLQGDDVIQILRKNRFTIQDVRSNLFELAVIVANDFAKALTSRTQFDYDNYMAARRNATQICKNRISERVVCWMIYTKYPELDGGNDAVLLEKFGNGFTHYFLYDISDLLKKICGGSGKSELSEDMLNRADMLLEDLQVEANAHLAESNEDDSIDISSRSDSEKYICLLEAILTVRNDVRKLRGEKVHLQSEISGLFNLIEQLGNFILNREGNLINREDSSVSRESNPIPEPETSETLDRTLSRDPDSQTNSAFPQVDEPV